MTEDEWRTGTRPGPMLDWLEASHCATARKKRLFVYSACRLGWDDLRPEVRRLIEAAEDDADEPIREGMHPANRGEFHDALLSLLRVTLTDLESTTFQLIGFAVGGNGKAPAVMAAVEDLADVAPPAALAALLREQFRDPSRKAHWVPARLRDRIDTRPRTARPTDLLLVNEWLTWEGGLVPGLARAIDEERAWDRMPILGDALEDAGCGEAALLDHLRQGGGHVRGCWVLDLLLGRG